MYKLTCHSSLLMSRFQRSRDYSGKFKREWISVTLCKMDKQYCSSMIHLIRCIENLDTETCLLAIIHNVPNIKYIKFMKISMCDSNFDDYVNSNLHVIVRFVCVTDGTYSKAHPHIDVQLWSIHYFNVIKCNYDIYIKVKLHIRRAEYK